MGFVVFNQPQISTNYHELFFHVPIVAPLSMEVWHKMCSINYAACFMLYNLCGGVGGGEGWGCKRLHK